VSFISAARLATGGAQPPRGARPPLPRMPPPPPAAGGPSGTPGPRPWPAAARRHRAGRSPPPPPSSPPHPAPPGPPPPPHPPPPPLRPRPSPRPPRQRHVSARQDAEADDVHVLLDGLLHDLLGRTLEPGVDDLHAGVAQRLRHHLGAAVVAVEPGLGDEDLHAATSSVTRRAVTRAPTTVRRASEIGSLNRRGPALPGFR